MIDPVAGEIVDRISAHQQILAVGALLVAADHDAVEQIGEVIVDHRDAGRLIDNGAGRDRHRCARRKRLPRDVAPRIHIVTLEDDIVAVAYRDQRLSGRRAIVRDGQSGQSPMRCGLASADGQRGKSRRLSQTGPTASHAF